MRSLLSVWEVATGIVTAQAGCERELATLGWHRGSGLPECICLAGVRLSSACVQVEGLASSLSGLGSPIVADVATQRAEPALLHSCPR